MDTDTKKIKSKNLVFERHSSDAGSIYKTECPNCHQKIKIAESSWWDTECECGFTWELSISATGTNYNLD